jgi:putative hydrolase of the HAD superfamily
VRPDWWGVSARLCRGLGVTGEQLLAAFEATRHHRGTGQTGSALGDLQALAAACQVEHDPAVLETLVEETLASLRASIHLYEDVLPTLSALREEGTRVALVSNCDHATIPLLQALGLDAVLDAKVLSCEVGWVKPDPRIFHESLRRLGASPEESVFVDDQPAFLDAAAALGIATFHILRPEPDGPARATSGHRTISSLAEITSPRSG